jgi:hypothetical protein
MTSLSSLGTASAVVLPLVAVRRLPTPPLLLLLLLVLLLLLPGLSSSSQPPTGSELQL